MFSYWRIVFGLKPCQSDREIIDGFKKSFCSIVVFQHCDTDNDGCWCGRPHMHFHGVVEIFDGSNLKINDVTEKLSEYCLYASFEPCSYVNCFLESFALQNIVFKYFLNNSELPRYFEKITPERQQEQKNKRLLKKMESSYRSRHISNSIFRIKRSGFKDLTTLSSCCKDEARKAPYKIGGDWELALRIARKMILGENILALSKECKVNGDYLSLQASVEFVKEWCLYQNVNIKVFVNCWIQCLDKNFGSRYCIYLHGAQHSGKTYITESIIQACIFVGRVKGETSGYAYFWENCIDKRLIVIYEPHFDAVKRVDVLENVLSGSGTLITKRDGSVDYLQPTPVVILTNNNIWEHHSKLDQRITSKYAYSFINLKQFSKVPGKKLHPGWLNALNEVYNVTSHGSNRETDQDNGFMLKIEN